MSDVDGSARIENGEDAGIIEAGGVFRAVFDLGAETKGVSTRVYLVDRPDSPWRR